jgi:hypothetical protein
MEGRPADQHERTNHESDPDDCRSETKLLKVPELAGSASLDSGTICPKGPRPRFILRNPRVYHLILCAATSELLCPGRLGFASYAFSRSNAASKATPLGAKS